MKIIKKDITTVEGPAIILHGVNCQGRMGSGVAKALLDKWPVVRERYLKTASRDRVLGAIEPIEVEPDLWVLNGYTQENFGYDGEVYADLEAIGTCVENAINFANILNIGTLCLPWIGTGLGGLSKEDVKKTIEIYENSMEYNVIICEIEGE